MIKIKKHSGYAEHTIVTGLDEKRDNDFNSGKEISVSLIEFELLKNRNWVEIPTGEVEDAS